MSVLLQVEVTAVEGMCRTATGGVLMPRHHIVHRGPRIIDSRHDHDGRADTDLGTSQGLGKVVM